jgi:hypothetical protein
MGGIDIVLRDKEGKIKQDYHVSREKDNKKIVEIDTIKKQENKK